MKIYKCIYCNFKCNSNFNYDRHCNTEKHLQNIQEIKQNSLYCFFCNKEYNHISSFQRHKKTICREFIYKQNNDINLSEPTDCINNEETISQLTNKVIDLENTLSKMKLQQEIINNSHNTNSHNTTNNTNSHNTTNINISKVEFINLNFSEVIDIESFIDNLENNPEFDLTSEETGNILFNQQNGGLLSAVASIVYYIKDNLIKQYQKKGKHISRKDIITPFILYDKGLREHFEKNINGKWVATSNIKLDIS
jgi:hypothetical protein